MPLYFDKVGRLWKIPPQKKPVKGGLPYSPGLRPRTPPSTGDLRERLETISHLPGMGAPEAPTSSDPATSSPSALDLPISISRTVKGVYIQISFFQDGELQKEEIDFLVPIRPQWKIEGLGNFESKDLIFVPLKNMSSQDWQEIAFQQCRPALIASLEGRYPK